MRKVLSYLKPYARSVIGAIIFTTAGSGLGLLLPLIMSQILNNGVSGGKLSYIYKMGSIMVGIAILAVIFSIIASYSSARAAAGFGRQVRKEIFHKVETLSQNDIDKIGTPSLITRSTNDIRQIQELLLIALRIIISAPIMMVGGIVMAFIINKKLSVVVLIVMPIVIGIALLVMKKVGPLFKVVQTKTDALNQILRERLSGIKVIRAFNKSEIEKQHFDITNSDLAKITLKINRVFALIIPLAEFLLYTLVTVIVFLGSRQLIDLDVVTQAEKIANTAGDLQAFVLYILLIIAAVAMAGAMFVMVPKASVSAKRISEVLDLEPSIKDGNKTAENSEKEEIEFKNVTFGYDNTENIIENISFVAPKGKVTALIGGTGSGKSTIVNLIPRFYDITEGEILLNGINIKELPLKELHQKVSFIPQKALLFSGTIEENIRYGKEDATKKEIWNVLEIAQAKDFVEALPRGLQSLVSQNATNYSGGQKQRLAIARALIRNADYYVFDDSFSALDFKTDAQLRKAIKENLSQSALIIVAQRVGTIIDADNIIVLDEGKIVGQGTHKQLLESCPIYKEICLSQLSEEEL
ncbi:MAG: ABC transporter ATP-binding protein/permease [Clostridiales bacterium]|nr:ABC transporter ATP-binding protein/permease [Clostridiales bacterium]